VRPGPPGWRYQIPPHPYPHRRRPALGGVAMLVVVTVLAALAAPHAHTLRGVVAGGLADLPAIRLPDRSPSAGDGARAAQAVVFALAQRAKPYRWGTNTGPTTWSGASTSTTTPRWRGAGRLVQVALAAGLTFELAWLEYPATRGRERRLKNQGSAYRRCPLCRGTGGPLDPAAAVAAIQPSQLPRPPSAGRR
jgi:hypothetical protein